MDTKNYEMPSFYFNIEIWLTFKVAEKFATGILEAIVKIL